jgi:hypothetical protein
MLETQKETEVGRIYGDNIAGNAYPYMDLPSAGIWNNHDVL